MQFMGKDLSMIPGHLIGNVTILITFLATEFNNLDAPFFGHHSNTQKRSIYPILLFFIYIKIADEDFSGMML